MPLSLDRYKKLVGSFPEAKLIQGPGRTNFLTTMLETEGETGKIVDRLKKRVEQLEQPGRVNSFSPQFSYRYLRLDSRPERGFRLTQRSGPEDVRG